MALFPVNKFVIGRVQRDDVAQLNVAHAVQPAVMAAAQPVAPGRALLVEANGVQPLEIATTQPIVTRSVLLDASLSAKFFTPISILPVTFINPPIPVVSTKNGNLFNDRFDNNLLWYLPVFSLLPATDASFSFVATQSELLDSEGKPFYVANVKFTIHKEVPPDAVAAKAGNNAISVKEIPLDALQLTLLLAYNDEQGNEAHTTYTGTIQAVSDGNYEVHIDNIKGKHVVILYQNLKVTGKVQIALSATYLAWREPGTPMLFLAKRILLQMLFERRSLLKTLIQSGLKLFRCTHRRGRNRQRRDLMKRKRFMKRLI